MVSHNSMQISIISSSVLMMGKSQNLSGIMFVGYVVDLLVIQLFLRITLLLIYVTFPRLVTEKIMSLHVILRYNNKNGSFIKMIKVIYYMGWNRC